MRALGSLGAAFALSVLLSACDDEPPQGPAPAAAPPSVSVAAVDFADVSAEYSFIGRVEATDRVELRARVEGFVLERLFEDGQAVAEGELLFLIEPERFEAAVALAKANVDSAQATLDEAEQTLGRQAQLLERGNTSQAAYDQALAAQKNAAAQLAARQAELRNAEIELGYTQIVAPLTGRVAASQVSRGELIGPGSGALTTVTSLDPINVTFQLSERDYVAVRRTSLEAGTAGDGSGVEVSLLLPDGSPHPETGTIDYVGDTIDPNSGTVPIRIVIANPGTLLLPGQFVTVELRSREVEQKLVVPLVALQQNQTGHFVLLVDAANRVEARNVSLGPQQGTLRVVESGLQVGDLVIVEGVQKVRPGVTVQPLRQDGTD